MFITCLRFKVFHDTCNWSWLIIIYFLLFIIMYYYMALSDKDWELPNSWIWLAEMDIDRGLDFPI